MWVVLVTKVLECVFVHLHVRVSNARLSRTCSSEVYSLCLILIWSSANLTELCRDLRPELRMSTLVIETRLRYSTCLEASTAS